MAHLCRSHIAWRSISAKMFCLLLSWLAGAAARGAGKAWKPEHMKFTGFLIPGFASTRLRAWAMLDCPYTPLDFNPLDPVWLDTKKVMGATSCWLKCIMLNQTTQEDDPDCRARADTGLNAITELDPGYITGPLSSVWREWVNWCVEFGIEPDAMVAMPYDWRLYPRMLEDRDLYFHKLKITFEAAKKLRGAPALVFAHSMGNNVFRYFLEWLRHEVAPRDYQPWIDEHIHAYHAIAAPLLGAPEAIKGFFTGLTFGLPISEASARVMGNSFGASMWMFPFSPFCSSDPTLCMRKLDGRSRPEYTCGHGESTVNASGWPVDIVTLDTVPIPNIANAAHPGVSPDAAAATEVGEDHFEADRMYRAADIGSGQMFREIADLDKDARIFAENIEKWYLEDPILNPLTPWDRPPIKNVYCEYGIETKTEVGYAYAPSTGAYPENWHLSDVYYETEGGELKSRSGLPVYGNKFAASGDVTVPYYSLSWCKQWLGPKVNITRAPMVAHDESHVQKKQNAEHVMSKGGIYEDIYPSEFTRDPTGGKYITFYEDSESIPGQKTAVWELDKVDHRAIVQNTVLLREVFLEVLHSAHASPIHRFVSKDYREPMRDEDCYWDYSKARCALSLSCEYRYVFGDVHLGQSCRLKQLQNETDHFARYL